MTRISKSGCIGVMVALAAPLALAQTSSPTGSPSFEVTAQRPRHDVTTLCPAIHAQLPDALVHAYNDTGARGTVDVLMTVRGPYVGNVATLEGPTVLQRAVRRAVRLNVTCSTAEATPQYVFFRVQFVDEAESKAAIAPRPAVLVVAGR